MRRILAIIIILLFLAACGKADTHAGGEEEPSAVVTPETESTPTPTQTPTSTASAIPASPPVMSVPMYAVPDDAPEVTDRVRGYKFPPAYMKNSAAAGLFDDFRDLYDRDFGPDWYPDGYGGAYISENNDLVIKIVEGSEELEEFVCENMSDVVSESESAKDEPPVVLFEYTDISLIELQELAATVGELMDEYDIVMTVSISQTYSAVKVGILDLELNREIVEERLTDSHFIFEDSGPMELLNGSAGE